MDDRRASGFLALGDSYTIGEGVEDWQCWPAQLAARLQAQDVQIDAVDIVATTGWTTDELQQAIDAREFKPPYALVSLLIGVNNQYRGRDLDNYSDDLSRLLDFAVTMTGNDADKLIIVSIPDWGITRFAAEQGVDAKSVAAQIDQFNAIAGSLAETRGAHWVDVTEISRAQTPDWIAQDGLHPSAGQYACWVDAIFPVACGILESSAQGRL